MATGLQTIINMAETIEFNRRKMTGVQYTQSEIPKVSETPTRNPWKIGIGFRAALPYNSNRDLLERLDTLDRGKPEIVSFSDNANLSWICAYQGSMTTLQINALTVSSFTGNQLVLTGLPTVASSTVLFKAGDFIQVGTGNTNPYPFTVVEDVLRGSSNTVTITTHRPNFITSSVFGLSVTVGNAVKFKVFCPNMPVYSLMPGAPTRDSNGNLTNNAYIQFSEDFKLFEWVGGA